MQKSRRKSLLQFTNYILFNIQSFQKQFDAQIREQAKRFVVECKKNTIVCTEIDVRIGLNWVR